MRSDKSHLLIIKEEKNQVVIIKISQGIHSKPSFFDHPGRPGSWIHCGMK